MTLVQEKYKFLAPRIELLADSIVLAQAWKKSHSYIRKHNWYADILELDCSAVGLEHNIAAWAKQLNSGLYRTQPSQLIPAPKNCPWIFDDSEDGWQINRKVDAKPVLRPLAHIGIREQTVASAVMLCLADCLETAQGNTALPSIEAQKKGVHSYGNRLFCQHPKEQSAIFSWGNSDTYSRYFQDYQQFVRRPFDVAQSKSWLNGIKSTIYVAKLDVSAFYDNIDIHHLIATLREEYQRFQKKMGRVSADDEFWQEALNALSFQWSDSAHAFAHLLRDNRLPIGLPQGLVASGFFANAYLLPFDREMSGLIGKVRTRAGTSFRVLDYCRYVDDIRLVISDTGGATEATLSEALSTFVDEVLKEQVSRRIPLRLNRVKTELELFKATAGPSGASASMKTLQAQLSGPFDLAELEHMETALTGLLAVAELGFQTQNNLVLQKSNSALALVARPKLDVRDDTLARFAAYRLTKALRQRQKMTDLSTEGGGPHAAAVLAHDFEVVARRLIAVWAVNPSMVQVLKYAMDLFPSPAVLAPVIDELLKKTAAHEINIEGHVAFYVLAELLRAGATETGFTINYGEGVDAQPVGDLQSYRDSLSNLSRQMLCRRHVPWYVKQQASFFLSCFDGHHSVPDIPQLHLHTLLRDFLFSETEQSNAASFNDLLATALVGHQVQGDSNRFVYWLGRASRTISPTEFSWALSIVSEISDSLYDEIMKADESVFYRSIPAYLNNYWNDEQIYLDDVDLPINEKMSLTTAITHHTTPFNSENALLKLAEALGGISPEFDHSRLTPNEISISCSDWSALKDPSRDVLELKIESPNLGKDRHYGAPEWCKPGLEILYAYGRVLRAASVGNRDFTVRNWLSNDELGRYSGLRSLWTNRRIGMLHTSKALVGTTSAITPWFTNLLRNLLPWPGTSLDEEVANMLGASPSTESFIQVVTDRIKVQRSFYGASSGLPIYEYPVNWDLHDKRHLRVLMIQGLMPSFEDLKNNGIAGLGLNGYRQRHRRHTAELLKLARDKIVARETALQENGDLSIDLVVLPEYSIHVDDQDLLRAFSDATGAIVFCGLLGAHGSTSSTYVNAGRWLVPQRRSGGQRSWITVDQGKHYLTAPEKSIPLLKSWRPYQVVIRLNFTGGGFFRISGAICYDATNLSLASDLKNISHLFVVAALNADIKTFDGMVSALRYHMYQHVLVVNSGEFGGSTAQAPYDVEHKRLLSHSHGNEQITATIFDVPIDHFGPATQKGESIIVTKDVNQRVGKTPPAGIDFHRRSK